ncbi:hypothetical protein KR059_011870 [Drosophila kikkawai]|nr:hypothetical protein KR059_011870 [Drosophila kikkawai]
MLKSAAICLYFATVAWHVNKCLAVPKDNGRSVCLLEDPPNQCGQFCLTALKPMINHIERHQDEWMSACSAAKANETQGKLEQMQGQLLSLQSGQSNVQEALRKVGSSLETSWEKLNPEDFKARLERMESQNTAQMELLQGVRTSMEASKQAVPPDFVKSQLLSLQSGQSNMQEALRKVGSSLETSWEKLNPEDFKARLERMESQSTAQMELLKAVKTLMDASKQAVPRDFVKAGSRYFYIEDNSKQNWFSASHTCRRMGGYLASPRKEELDALNLKAGVTYWFGISDLADEGRFISSFNGNPASFLKWRPNEPNNVRNSQHCVTFNNRGMDDDNCDKKFNFICQASEENL